MSVTKDLIGAIGVAILAYEKIESEKSRTRFKGFSVACDESQSRSFVCADCPNQCEIVSVLENQKEIGYFGDRCGEYSEVSLATVL